MKVAHITKLILEKIMEIHSLNNHQLLADIDNLVISILLGQPNLSEVTSSLNLLYPAMVSIYDSRLCYTETIQLFISATGMIFAEFEELKSEPWRREHASMFINELHRHIILYHQSVSNFSIQESLNKESLNNYISELTAHYGRLLFVRVDLKYRTECQGLVSLHEFIEHIKKLQQRLSNKKSCFKDLQGYTWALEQGSDKGGLHCHLLLIYDGAKHQKGWGLGEKVGEKWREITENYGCHFNCHSTDYINKYQANGELGIGMIHRNSELEVANAIRTACYLTDPAKYDQRLKAKLPNMRTFGHGVYRNATRRGLPQ